MSGPPIGYALARCHARHAARPGALAWRRLDGARTAGQYLQLARATGLRPWLRNIGEEEHQQNVELKLRQAFRRYVTEVTGWLPAAARPAALWTARLVDLGALAYLHAGGRVQPWMADDPVLSPETDTAAPQVVVSGSDDPVAAWLEEWRARWPGPRHDPLAPRLGDILLGLVTTGQAPPAAERLRWLFRGHATDPTGIYAHLGLTLDDLRRLAGGLASRRPGQARFAEEAA